MDHFQHHQLSSIKITNFFNITLVLNKGISFGLFNYGQFNNYIFLVLALIITIIVLKLLIKSSTLVSQISYSLIIAGAIGNIIDRFNNGAVLDFIELHISHYYWPAFNVADSSICIGAILLLYDTIFNELNTKAV